VKVWVGFYGTTKKNRLTFDKKLVNCICYEETRKEVHYEC
jgi:hypothetical protein